MDQTTRLQENLQETTLVKLQYRFRVQENFLFVVLCCCLTSQPSRLQAPSPLFCNTRLPMLASASKSCVYFRMACMTSRPPHTKGVRHSVDCPVAYVVTLSFLWFLGSSDGATKPEKYILFFQGSLSCLVIKGRRSQGACSGRCHLLQFNDLLNVSKQ